MSIRTEVRKMFIASVFAPMNIDPFDIRLIITLFHRATATLYFVLFLWGFSTIFTDINSVEEVMGEVWQTAFSIILSIVALIACYGATFFPSSKRAELYAGASIITMILSYQVFLVIVGVWENDPSKYSFALCVAYGLPIPVVRSYIIYKRMVREGATALRKKRAKR